MTTLLLALFVALAVGFPAWRIVVARRAPSRIADTEIAPPEAAPAADPARRQRTPEEEAARATARATARAKAERVIAAEAARRKAAIQKAQNVARAEAERRAAEAAKAAASLVSTLPASQLPTPGRQAPAATPAPTRPAVVERTVPPPRPAAVAPAVPAATLLKTIEQTLIMLVDDSKMVRVKSSRLLASHGFQVVTANDGIDALKQLENCCPDLIITDVDMPEMDGFGLVAALKGDARTRQTPLVMITSAEDRHRDEALRVGVGLVMGKPYDEAALIAHIRSFKFFAKAEEAESLACA